MTQQSPPRKRVYVFLLVVAVLAVGGYFGNQYFNSSQEASADAKAGESADQTKAEDAVIPVELAEAEIGEIASKLTATANLRPLREVEILSQTEAQVLTIEAEEGDRVREGQALCRLDDRQLQIRMESARQKLAQARLQLEKAQIRREKAATQIANSREEYDRYDKLFKEKLVSEREVAQLQYRIDELEHDERVSTHETRELSHRVDELISEISQIELEIAQTRITAPFSGVITERAIERGQTVRRLDRIFKLGSFSTLYADVFLSEREARQVEPGQEVGVALGVDERQRSSAKVARISPVVDQATGTVKVTVELAGTEEGFKPGAFVKVAIETDRRKRALLIPKRALIEQDSTFHVYVVNDGSAVRADVVLGYQDGERVEIVEGLRPGQKVVVAGQGALKDGTKVKVIAG